MGEQQISKCQPDPNSFTALIQDRLRQFCKFVESLRGGRLMHYLDATPRIWPFFWAAPIFAGAGGLKMLLGGRTAGHWPLSGPQGATPPPLSHSLTGGRLLLQIASATAIRAQPSVRVCSLVTLARVASCSQAESSRPCQNRNCHWWKLNSLSCR